MADVPATTCACTRIHIGEASRPPDVDALRAFVDRVAPHVDRVAIAVGAPGIDDTAERLRQLSDLVARCQAATRDAETIVDIIPVDPWGAFTPALNALAAHASKQGCGLALFASVETTFSSETVAALREQLVTHDALVVGAALPGHDFREGRRPLGGRTAPWNTLALWRLDRLCLVGFPLVADGVHAGVCRQCPFPIRRLLDGVTLWVFCRSTQSCAPGSLLNYPAGRRGRRGGRHDTSGARPRSE